MTISYAVNYLAVIVAAIAGFIVGWLWWGPLFGKTWVRLSGMSKNDIDKAKKKGMAGPMIIALIAQLIMAWVLAALIITLGEVGYVATSMLAFWLWLGFVATIGVGMVLWQGKPWGLFWVNNLGWLVSLLVMAIVISLF